MSSRRWQDLSRLTVLLIPVLLLTVVGVRLPGMTSLFWLGTLVLLLGCLLVLISRHFGRETTGSAVIMLYVIALGWLLLAVPAVQDGFLHLSQAILLVVPLGLFGVQCLRDSGAVILRRARCHAARLMKRRDWPSDLMECRLVPEVKELRDLLSLDATPALEMLASQSPAVRVAALAALEFRQHWRPGQPQVILQFARRSPEAEVRAAAVFALANVDDRIMIEAVAELLRDPSRLVRQTTAVALLWSTDTRWTWFRDSLRHAMAEPSFLDDGPLPLPATPLTREALTDLHAWCADKGPIALRAALTLGAYYGRVLAAGAPPELVPYLRKQLTHPQTPALLRLELARLLNHFQELDPGSLRRMVDSSVPAPVRLIAVEALLAQGDSSEAVAALYELGRSPNREIALSTADVVQRRLGIDLGLPRGQALPPVQSRMAAEVARRVHAWATQHEVDQGAPQYAQPADGSEVDL